MKAHTLRKACMRYKNVSRPFRATTQIRRMDFFATPGVKNKGEYEIKEKEPRLRSRYSD